MGRPVILASGLFRSGTNYLQALIDANLDTDPLPVSPRTGRFAYKHVSCPGGLHSHFPGLGLALIHKPPAKWIDSLCRNSFDLIECYELGFEPGHTVIEIACDDEDEPVSDRPSIPVSLEKLCALYERYFRFWQKARVDWRHVFVKHTFAAFEPESCLDELATVFGAERLTFRPLEGPVRNSRPFTAEVAATYRDPEAFEHLRGHHLDAIGRCVSPEILDFLGYPRG